MTDAHEAAGGARPGGFLHALLQRLSDVRPNEVQALAWSWLYIFSVLSSYYIMRPIRDQMGVAGGVNNLQWLFTGTLVGMLLLSVPFAFPIHEHPYDYWRFTEQGLRVLLENFLDHPRSDALFMSLGDPKNPHTVLALARKGSMAVTPRAATAIERVAEAFTKYVLNLAKEESSPTDRPISPGVAGADRIPCSDPSARGPR